ncbi:MAG TPA: homoserine dehydrogenase [Magnetospirillaceae bacterium]|nr:homoserine dehydrogenase [Magnetospirillaceae bacterium]
MQAVEIAILGFGTVGSGTYRILKEHANAIARRAAAPILVKSILVRDASRNRPVDTPQGTLTESFDRILADPDIRIVVEALGGEEPALDYILAALGAGKDVVTANKLVLSLHGRRIFEAARASGRRVAFEGAVAGGIPVIRTLREGLTANNIERITGILNGTTNFILSAMTDRGMEYEAALREAQDLGYAEADPSSDVDGYDASYKLSILASLGFEGYVDPRHIPCRGIVSITALDIALADRFGFRIKLLACAERADGTLHASVTPSLVPKAHPLASVNGAYNAVAIEGDSVGQLMLYGKGAGDLPTGSAVVSDIIELVRFPDLSESEIIWPDREIRLSEISARTSQYYVRLLVKDLPGVLGQIATVLGVHGISIATLTQELDNAGRATLLIFTHECDWKAVDSAAGTLRTMPFVLAVANILPLWADTRL